MTTYQVLLMRPYDFVLAHEDFNDLSDLQYMAIVQAEDALAAYRKALTELKKADRKDKLYQEAWDDNYLVIGHFLDGVWSPCFNQPRWIKGH